MAHKYNKINKEQVLDLFKEKPIITRADVTNKYNCSIYLVTQLIDELNDGNKIRLTNYGYKQI
jgi:hypothetical protein